jgi:SHS family lactate transporter-like MFS transporter
MSALGLMPSLNREQRNTFLASFLGWMLDAFDFFLVTFITLHIAKDLV